MRNPLMIGEMMRALDAAAVKSPEAVDRPELAAELIRRLTLSPTAMDGLDAGIPEARRRRERTAVKLFFSIWYGRTLEAIELEDGSVVYRLVRGHCGSGECCGSEPLRAYLE